MGYRHSNHHDHHHSEDGHDDGGDLGASEMHAAALGERVAEVARRTTDPVLGQVGLLIVVITFSIKQNDEEARPQLLQPGCPGCFPPSSEQSPRRRFPRADNQEVILITMMMKLIYDDQDDIVDNFE